MGTEICKQTEMGGAKSRIVVYDWLRLIATIMVVIGHSTYLGGETTFGTVSFQLPETLSAAYDSFTFSQEPSSFSSCALSAGN